METKSKKYNDLSENIINDKTRFKTSEININENLNIIQNSIKPYSSEYKINSTNKNLNENNDIINNIKEHEDNNENNIQNELMKNDNNLDNLILETSHHNTLIQSSLMPNIKQDKEKNINISIIDKNITKEEKAFDDIIISENNVENKSKSQEKKIYSINIKSYLKIIKLLLGNKEKKEAMNVSLFNEYEKYILTIKNYFDNLKTQENNGKSIIKGNNEKKLFKKEYKILIQKLIEKINIIQKLYYIIIIIKASYKNSKEKDDIIKLEMEKIEIIKKEIEEIKNKIILKKEQKENYELNMYLLREIIIELNKIYVSNEKTKKSYLSNLKEFLKIKGFNDNNIKEVIKNEKEGKVHYKIKEKEVPKKIWILIIPLLFIIDFIFTHGKIIKFE